MDIPDLECRFPLATLQKIVDEATLYSCGCPAQVCEQIRRLRELYDYQRRCSETASELTAGSHRVIAEQTAAAHRLLEDCLDRVLDLEGWDRTTFKMPPGLRQLQTSEVARWNDGRDS